MKRLPMLVLLTAPYVLLLLYLSENGPLLLWRAHANNLYTNWLNYYVHQTTPYTHFSCPAWDFRVNSSYFGAWF